MLIGWVACKSKDVTVKLTVRPFGSMQIFEGVTDLTADQI